MRRSACLVPVVLGLVGGFAACVGDDPALVSPPTTTPESGTPEAGADNFVPVADAAPDSPSCTAPTQACGTSCVVVSKDPANCGRCGHDCAGGGCTTGVCQPVTLTTTTNPTLNSSRLSTDGTSVCWTVAQSTGFVYCVPTAPAAPAVPTEVWTGKRPTPVLVRGGKVLWTAQGAASSSTLRLMSGTPGTASSGIQVQEWVPSGTITTYDGYQLDLIGTLPYLSWTESLTDSTYSLQVIKCADAACAGYTKIHTVNSASSLDSRANGMASDAAAVYVTYGGLATGTVMRVAPSGAGTALAATEVDPQRLSVDGGFAYWDTNTLKIRRSPIGAATPTDVSVALSNVIGLVAHGDTVYWTELGATGVYMAPAAGGARAVYVTGEAADEPGYLAHDDKAIYWTDKSTGGVRKIAFK